MVDPNLSIVIVNYNTKDYTAQCLDSIRAVAPALTYEIILIDNASSDGSADELEQRYPEVHLIRSPVNGGIAGGNNLGIRTACGTYVLLLNNDTLVLPGTLERAVAYLKDHSDVAGVGGDLLNSDRSFQASYARFPTLWHEFLGATSLGPLLNRHYPSASPGNEVREVDWIGTAFMVFRRDALEQVGFVDEEFFIYSDETDLQYRLHQTGWKIVYLPNLPTIHFGGKSLTPWRRRHLVYRGKLLFFKKHYGPLRTLALRGIFAVVGLVKVWGWGLLWLLPARRERARNEILSYRQVIRWSTRSNLAL